MDINNNESFAKDSSETFLPGHFQTDAVKGMPPPPPYPSKSLPCLTSGVGVGFAHQASAGALSPHESVHSAVYSVGKPTCSADLNCGNINGCPLILVQAETPAPPVTSDPHSVINVNVNSHVPVSLLVIKRKIF